MARTPIFHEEKKAQITQAALTTFSRYGYEGATNKLIAQEVGKLIGQEGKPISPALIYHYFPQGKSQLFAECLSQFPTLQQFSQLLIDNLEQPPELFLRLVARTYNEVLKTEGVLPILRMVLNEAPRQPELVTALQGLIGPKLLLPMLGYFEKQIRAGHVRAIKPDQIGMQLFAPLVMRRILLSIFPGSALPMVTSDDDEFIETIVQIILQGFFNKQSTVFTVCKQN
ncbi:MAG: TetR/AcrR family transcriptional regulator [Chloroflexota bacterium]